MLPQLPRTSTPSKPHVHAEHQLLTPPVLEDDSTLGDREVSDIMNVQLHQRQKGSSALLIGPFEYSAYVKSLWPSPTSASVRLSPIHMNIFQQVRDSNLPNYLSARIPVPSEMNCDAWDHLLSDYHDKEVCQFLRFGWPSSYTAPHIPTPTHRNHPSATAYTSDIEAFLEKEVSKGALLGPFDTPPFQPWTNNSPLMTAEKKESLGRRVIIDLSFPEGSSVNDGVAKNFFQGAPATYTLPTVHDLAQLIVARGPGTLIWKTDLERAYRQLRSDPLDYPLMGISHGGKHYVEICPSFVSRGSSAAQQRVSAAICALMAAKGYHTLAYVDDFCGVHSDYTEATRAFAAFESLCEILGVKIAPKKSAYPSTAMNWLGFHFDTVSMTITIPPTKLQEILDIAEAWETKKSATRREFQVLAGKLNHVALCVLPARRFMSRILAALRHAPQSGHVKVGPEVRRDVTWFSKYARACNGLYLLRPVVGQFLIECEACLEGGGGFSDAAYYSVRFPLQWILDHHISRLEALNLIIAIKTLIPPDLVCAEVVVKTDNIATAFSLTTGKAHDPVMAACSRELWLVAATNQLVISIQHVPGETLVLADALSRRHKSPHFEQYIHKTVTALNINSVTPVSCEHVLTPNL